MHDKGNDGSPRSNVHKRSNYTTTIASSYLHGNTHASLDAATNIIAIPHDQDRNHRVPNLMSTVSTVVAVVELYLHS